MQSLEMTSGDLETTSQFGTWKRMQKSFQRLQQLLEVAATVGSCGNCWKLRRFLEAAGEARNADSRRGPQRDGKLSFYFNFNFIPYNSNKPRLQTESCLFSSTDVTANHRLTATVMSLQCNVNKTLAPLEEPPRPNSGLY